MDNDFDIGLERERKMHEALMAVNHDRFYCPGGGILEEKSFDWLEWPDAGEKDSSDVYDRTLGLHSPDNIVHLRFGDVSASYFDEVQNRIVDPYVEAVLESASWSTTSSLNRTEIVTSRDEAERRYEEYRRSLKDQQRKMQAVFKVWAYEVGKPLLKGYDSVGDEVPWAEFLGGIRKAWDEMHYAYLPERAEEKLDKVLMKYRRDVDDVFTSCQRAGLLYYYGLWKKVFILAHRVYAGYQGYEHTLQAIIEGRYHPRWIREKEYYMAEVQGDIPDKKRAIEIGQALIDGKKNDASFFEKEFAGEVGKFLEWAGKVIGMSHVTARKALVATGCFAKGKQGVRGSNLSRTLEWTMAYASKAHQTKEK